jgi:hypothetical protein
MKWPRLESGAANDVVAAAERFAKISSRLAAEFTDAFDAALGQIQKSPRQFPLLETNTGSREFRRVVLHRFNYVIIYEMFGDTPQVAAVMHGSQQPNSWAERRE